MEQYRRRETRMRSPTRPLHPYYLATNGVRVGLEELVPTLRLALVALDDGNLAGVRACLLSLLRPSNMRAD